MRLILWDATSCELMTPNNQSATPIELQLNAFYSVVKYRLSNIQSRLLSGALRAAMKIPQIYSPISIEYLTVFEPMFSSNSIVCKGDGLLDRFHMTFWWFWRFLMTSTIFEVNFWIFSDSLDFFGKFFWIFSFGAVFDILSLFAFFCSFQVFFFTLDLFEVWWSYFFGLRVFSRFEDVFSVCGCFRDLRIFFDLKFLFDLDLFCKLERVLQ